MGGARHSHRRRTGEDGGARDGGDTVDGGGTRTYSGGTGATGNGFRHGTSVPP